MKRKERRDFQAEPPERLELPEKNTRLRLILTVVFIVIAVGAFAFAMYQMNKPETGWQRIGVTSAAQTQAGAQFVFNYNVGAGTMNARSELNQLSARYTSAIDTGYRALSNTAFSDCNNVYYLNHHVNEEVTVEPVLYDALRAIQEAGSRYPYLASVYAQYNGVFSCQNDYETVEFDPYQNAQLREEFARVAAFVADAQAVNVQLLGENRVKLHVSEEYLAFANEHAITEFVDLNLLSNAFLIDYVSDDLIGAGFTAGTISSFDGYSRTLDNSGTEYSFNLTNRVENKVYSAGIMRYTGAMSLVFLRNYPMNSLDEMHYYELADGQIRTPYVDAADGLSKTARNELVCFSQTQSCAQIALRVLPLYSTDSLDVRVLSELSPKGIDSVYCEDFTVHATSKNVTISDLFNEKGVTYSAVYDTIAAKP